jgi:putative spermidine/putrescine transport system permease protein
MATDNAAELRSDERRERFSILGLSFPALALVTLLVFLPVGWLFYLSVIDAGELSLIHYRRLADATHFRIFYITFEISILVTVLALLLGYPLAYLMSQLPPRWAGICLIFVLVPFWTSLLVRTYAWLVLLQRRGVINQTLMDLGLIDAPLRLVHNYTGTVIGMLHIMLPFMILPLYASLKTVDRTTCARLRASARARCAHSGRSSSRCRCRASSPAACWCSSSRSASTSRPRCSAAAA